MAKIKCDPDQCPVEIVMAFIGNKWKIFIVRELLDGTKRFNALLRSITGISQKVLTQNLRAMEKDGLITRAVFAEVPPRVEYSLSTRGNTLRPVIDAMAEWGARHQNGTKKIKVAGMATGATPATAGGGGVVSAPIRRKTTP